MNTKEIEMLLEKYDEGISTIREEKILKEFFNRPDVPGYLKSYQPLFKWSVKEQLTRVSDPAFDQKLASVLTEEALVPVIKMHSQRKRFFYLTAVAASFLLLIGFMFTWQVNYRSKVSVADKLSVELAYAEASEALNIVSNNLNVGLKQLDCLQCFDKATKNLAIFNKFYQYQTIIINPDELYYPSQKQK
jgi:hypothetical protein